MGWRFKVVVVRAGAGERGQTARGGRPASAFTACANSVAAAVPAPAAPSAKAHRPVVTGNVFLSQIREAALSFLGRFPALA